MEDGMDSLTKRPPMASPVGKTDVVAPSAVLCVKTDQSEVEVQQLLAPLGMDIMDTLFVLGKNMVFVEFKNVQESTTALNYITKSQIVTPSGYNVDAMYSLRKQITKTPRADGGIQQLGGNIGNATAVEMKLRNQDCPPNRVLLVHLKAVQTTSPPTVDNLMLPFSHFGMIEKMIVFHKQGAAMCQALIQYSTIEYAEFAMQKYQNQQMGAYRLTIHFSERPELEVAQNNSRMRDFLNPWLPEAQ